MKSDYFTNLGEAFDVLDNEVREYNWLLSNYECNVYPSKKIPMNNDKQFLWFNGDEFVDILKEHNIQFIWGVATAYAKDIPLKEILKYPLPFADGNPAFWEMETTMQNPLADIELVPWDSGFLLVFSKSKEVIERFAKEYPDSSDDPAGYSKERWLRLTKEPSSKSTFINSLSNHNSRWCN